MTETATHPLLETPAAGRPAEQAEVRAQVQDAMRGLAKAWRTYLLYEGRSPALDRIVDGLRDTLRSIFARTPFFTVAVEERELLFDGAPVYQGDDAERLAATPAAMGGPASTRENLAFTLYRDGLRELSFHKGVEREELDSLLEILAHVVRLRGEDQDDLLTLLWANDWYHLRYRYVEGLPDGVVVPTARAEEPVPVQYEPREEVQPLSTVSPDDFRGALYFLDSEELRRLEGELGREMRRDLWSDVLNALFDRIEDGGALRQEQIVGILRDLLPMLLGSGKLDMAALVLGELVKIATGGQRLPAQVMRELRTLFEQLAQPATVAELVRTVEEAGAAVNETALGSLLSFFPPDALGPLLKAAETSAVPAVRRTVQAAAERLAGTAREHVSRLVAEHDPAVAAGAARLIGRLRITTAAGDVARLLRRPEAGTRLAAVEALQELRSPTASEALEGALEDADGKVRVAAARALAALRYAPAKAKLEAALDGKRLRESELTERIAFFEAYGGLAGADGVPMLEKILNGKSWLGRRESPEIRACAALGLGRIRHPAAEKALNAAAADADPVVRSAVGRALKAVRQ
ncbi:HEAT repeat domain-containing protein [Longimicrobium sp.]|uniref:HEAT repeat domain-containing protein n=1 Tax=Longimicrobium sp. TaxID=2029185 RepID=UPI002BAEBD28|nr:HEAT repeat domain-containing protein [Longimicrobium sp.]HSU16637.1 HEAT repeat domain-containing protein [Longimicrobium sp.]